MLQSRLTYFSIRMFVVKQNGIFSLNIALVIDLRALISPFLSDPGQLVIPLLKMKSM